MTTSKIPPEPTESELLEDVERLEDIWPYMEHLRHRAHYELYNRGRQNYEFFAICVYGYSQCRDFFNLVMPSEDCDEILAQGLKPVITGIVPWNFFKRISKHALDLTASLADKPNKGMVRCVVLHQRGGSVFDIRPEPETGLH